MHAFQEKFAGWLNAPLRRMGAMKRLHQRQANSTGHKARKALGYGILGTGAAGYGMSKLYSDPDEKMVPRIGVPKR